MEEGEGGDSRRKGDVPGGRGAAGEGWRKRSTVKEMSREVEWNGEEENDEEAQRGAQS